MTTLVEQVIDLQPGAEWYSPPFALHIGRTLHVWGIGTVRFYAHVVNTALFDQLRGPGMQGAPRPWPFPFGSDRTEHDQYAPVQIGGMFRMVVRLGVFNMAGRVRVRVSED
jgi:hypothetical protein